MPLGFNFELTDFFFSFPPADLPTEEFNPDWLYSRLKELYGTWLPETGLNFITKFT